MTTNLTEKEFTRHLNTKFHIDLDGSGDLDLELVEVAGHKGQPEHPGMERFSAFFQGPMQPRLPQKMYLFKHETMGEFEMFIVPVAGKEQGILYEAVFNYYA